MLPPNNIQSIVGATIFGRDEVKLGRISQVFVDAADGHPTWAETHIGMFGRHTTYVPLHEATWEHDDIHVPYDEETVKKAPRVDGEGGLDPEQERELRAHYSGSTVADDDTGAESTADATDDRDPAMSDDNAGEATQHIDENGVLWEERTVVTTQQVPVARLHPATTADDAQGTEEAQRDPRTSDGTR